MYQTILKALLLFIIIPTITACAPSMHRNALGPNAVVDSNFIYHHSIRVWGDIQQLPKDSQHGKEQYEALHNNGLLLDNNGNWNTIDHLTISGGGAEGAYGAGLLNGWSATGNRPEFRLVTGISTGAVIGLYAFLGEDFNPQLAKLYTQTSDGDLYQKRGLFSLLRASSAFDTNGFEAMVRSEIDESVMAKVRQEHMRGRTFLVKTTNLDAQRPVIWNMGAIAMHEGEAAKQLFQDVIIASAAIPGLFEPVLLKVNIDGIEYDELHVDGGVTSNVFFLPKNLDLEKTLKKDRQHIEDLGLPATNAQTNRVWVLNNSRLAASWAETNPSMASIFGRSVFTLIKYMGRNNVAQIYQQSQQTDSEFKLSYIPHAIPEAPITSPFDKDYMRSLYCYGYLQGVDIDHWGTALPNYENAQRSLSAEEQRISANRDIDAFSFDTLAPGLQQQVTHCLNEIARRSAD